MHFIYLTYRLTVKQHYNHCIYIVVKKKYVAKITYYRDYFNVKVNFLAFVL